MVNKARLAVPNSPNDEMEVCKLKPCLININIYVYYLF